MTNDGVAMLPASVSPELAESVWIALGAGGGLAAVLDGIVSGSGTSLSALPSFAVVSRTAHGDEVQVAVRGPLEVQAVSAAGDIVVGGMGVATWTERGIEGAESITVGIPGADAPRLPMKDGVVLASQIAFTFGNRLTTPPPPAAPSVFEVPETPKNQPADVGQAAEPEFEAPAPEEPSIEAPAPEEPSIEAPAPQAPEPADEQSETLQPVPELQDLSPNDPNAETEPQALGEPSGTGETTIAPPLTVDPSREAATSEELPATEDYDNLLYGETTKKSVEGAAIRAVTESPAEARPIPTAMISGLPQFAAAAPPGPAHQDRLGDHDDETISTAKLQALLGNSSGQPGTAASPGPVAPALGAPATLVVSTGERVTLDRGAVVGRRPQLVRVQGGNVPRLVTVPSPNQDISRSHLELRVVGQDVLAVDLNTMNGTRLLRPGTDPVRLQPGDATILVAGDTLDLGDGIELGFEGLR
ncbi:FHA domain-containing protein [Arthrobacter sp. OV608]|uniref:FHA domain-containing protein n=1 Tax=Arthrobacter sp. OV608 TaxID=1882768 RepID=UPI001B8BC0BF|nr:FHA domain-containing protein [Arthrobacter sp. OV608]